MQLVLQAGTLLMIMLILKPQSHCANAVFSLVGGVEAAFKSVFKAWTGGRGNGPFTGPVNGACLTINRADKRSLGFLMSDVMTFPGSLEHFVDPLRSLKDVARVANAEKVLLVPNK